MQGLRDGNLGCLDMATWGLLSLLLRSLASADVLLRGLAYEGLALYAENLESSNFRCLHGDLLISGRTCLHRQ